MKYLEFLTGANLGITDLPEYKLHIQKSNSTSLFDFKPKHFYENEDDAAIMLELMRQEDERGEKQPKKLRQQMAKFTSSSRNLFNDKYSNFLRKLGEGGDSKSPQTSRSLISLFSSGFIKEESSMESSLNGGSLLELAKKSKNQLQRQAQLKSPHTIVRSISDNTAMKQHSGPNTPVMELKSSNIPIVGGILEDDYQDNTRSSPNISNFGKHMRGANSTEFRNAQMLDKRFGQFSAHSPHLLNQQEVKTVKSASSGGTLSLTLSNSFESYSSEEETVPEPKHIEKKSKEHEANSELTKMLKISSQETDEDQWIQPGQDLDDLLDYLPRPHKRHSIVQDIKTFSHNVQVIKL